MNFERYERLSEDAQRLLGYYVIQGMGTNKRMSEHLYVLSRYCFSGFVGDAALRELMEEGMIREVGKDWYINTMKYEVRISDVVPVLWYMYEKRRDLVEAYKKAKQTSNQVYLFLRSAVKQMVESGFTNGNAAAAIAPEQAVFLYGVAEERQMHRLIENLSTETFIKFCKGLFDYWIEQDMVCDITPITDIIMHYGPVTEATRYRLLALYDLYNFIATGKTPEEGVFQSVPEGMLQVAMSLLCRGNNEVSRNVFAGLVKRREDENGQSGFFYNPVVNLFYVMGLMRAGDATSKQILHMMLLKQEVKTWQTQQPSRILAQDFLGMNKQLHSSELMQMCNNACSQQIPKVYACLAYLISSYLGHPTLNMDMRVCEPRMALLRHEVSPYISMDDEEKAELDRLYGDVLVLNSIPHKAAWMDMLEELKKEVMGEPVKTDANDSTRLMYIRRSMDTDDVEVREQSRLKNGAWGSGKVLAETKYRRGDLPYMNDADKRIMSRMTSSGKWRLTLSDIIEDMVGEDRLYYGSTAPYEKVKVDRDQPYLIVEKENGQFVVKSNVSLKALNNNPIIVENSPTHYSVMRLTEQVRGWYMRLLSVGSFPLSAEESLRDFLPTIGGKVEVHSSLIEGGSTLPMVDGNSTVGFKLSPKNNGNYEIEVFVRPLQGGNRTYRLAQGNDVIIDENEEGRVRVKRNMAIEESNLSMVRELWLDAGFEMDEHNVYPAEFVLDLVQFVQLHPDFCFMEWPEGQNLKIRSLSRGLSSWSGVVKARGQWFEIEGDVRVDKDTVVSISQLLELIGKSHGKYVKLSDGEFLVLSEKLKMQLRSLEAVANRDHGQIRISPFSAALMNEEMLNGEIVFTLDQRLVDIRKQILESSTYSPEVPEGLNATLRPYQLDGYQWMARLNKWGAGAMLADDMGLGKTIQTIAFLLLKKEDGPSLVVAPASVAPNWKTELDKFAPGLNSKILNFATDRRQMIEDAKAGDVIITTYGILLSIQEDVTAKHWNVACLDEAHIIKNRGAKTSAAAMKIKADNRVMLTGTPVQNHLGELWSLFQFVNPGLLGGYENYSQKFIVPIEGHQDKEKQALLDKIVHPFMLRRTKQAVLKELPEKTEIYHQVELTKEELAVYESIRVRAERMLSDNMTTKGNGSEVDINVLAEITRLRQASCSAQLIEPKWTGECSKITTLVELLQGVIEGGNRALVFSQFVGFFDIVRKELEQRGMQYYYIDGSVPVKKRAELVASFQDGNCPLFLISLKAGGLGLNLTGANYVFHLDPWWNPAIEQQATDRAYRIGQNQAVTVYHLVSKNTIEEKIIRLHQTKRDLADNLLAGTDMSHKLTGEELLEMIRK